MEQLNIAIFYQITLFLLALAALLPKVGHVTEISPSFAMNLVETEVFSFLRQEITCQIILEA